MAMCISSTRTQRYRKVMKSGGGGGGGNIFDYDLGGSGGMPP